MRCATKIPRKTGASALPLFASVLPYVPQLIQYENGMKSCLYEH